jgi:hypothetical protein
MVAGRKAAVFVVVHPPRLNLDLEELEVPLHDQLIGFIPALFLFESHIVVDLDDRRARKLRDLIGCRKDLRVLA